ncbi:hypothetical protein AMECASPLE_037313 [Ameca splendens]|uniref:BED-type domain-containing protein n=1 Tax=Ameca splendens TaxID=208324 RepID=A0ABV0ZGK9_9TELE
MTFHAHGSTCGTNTFPLSKMVEDEKVRKKSGTNEKTEEKTTRTKTSKEWEHFTIDAVKRRVTCKICKNGLAWHGSTTSLHEYLRRKHIRIEAEEEEPAQ